MALEAGSLDITYTDGLPLSGVKSASEGQDVLRSTTGSTTGEPSVAGLRDRLLREARQERIRCLQVARASERWRGDDTATAPATTSIDIGTQTDPVVITPVGSTGGQTMDASFPDVWGQSDEEAQAEAIKAIQLLSQKKNNTSSSDKRVADLEEMLLIERTKVSQLESSIVREKQARDAVHQQVLCLEAEMDVKESALQASQRELERRNEVQVQDVMDMRSQLQVTNNGQVAYQVPRTTNLQALQRARSPMAPMARDGRLDHTLPSRMGALGRSVSPGNGRRFSGNAVMEESNLLAARRQQLERDQSTMYTMESKDQEISQLLRELRHSQDMGGAANMPMTTPNLNSFGYGR